VAYPIAYRVDGDGETMVFIKQGRYPVESAQLRLLRDHMRVVQIEPLGFGGSQRPAVHPEIHRQVLDVLDREGIGRFAVWGYSQGAAMAATVAVATDRVMALVAGGFSLLNRPIPARLDWLCENPRVPAAARAFWREFAAHDWCTELAELSCPTLMYVGGADRQFASALRRTRRWLVDYGTTVWELDGLDHRGCDDEPNVSTLVVPRVTAWLDVIQQRG
jgi:pimeloyl-ACP methyl ester carboxylesterase